MSASPGARASSDLPGAAQPVKLSTVSDKSAMVASSPVDNRGASPKVAALSDCCGPPSMAASRDNDFRVARHLGHDRMCAPRSNSAISRIRSAARFASCSRLGQPVMAIPPGFSSASSPNRFSTARRNPGRAVARLPCIHLGNPFVSLTQATFLHQIEFPTDVQSLPERPRRLIKSKNATRSSAWKCWSGLNQVPVFDLCLAEQRHNPVLLYVIKFRIRHPKTNTATVGSCHSSWSENRKKGSTN
jgi:hypothetical protein